jgi:hypothetical protein
MFNENRHDETSAQARACSTPDTVGDANSTNDMKPKVSCNMMRLPDCLLSLDSLQYGLCKSIDLYIMHSQFIQSFVPHECYTEVTDFHLMPDFHVLVENKLQFAHLGPYESLRALPY